GVGGREVAALEESSDGFGIFAIALGLAAMHGFHGVGVSEDEGDVVSAAGVGQPVPAMDTLAGDEQSVAEMLDSMEERLGLSGEVTGVARLAVVSRTTRKRALACRSTPA